MGFYQVVRYLGFSLGSALAASVLASRTATGSRLPSAGGYTMVFAIAAGISVVAATATHFVIIAPSSAVAGAAFSVTVTAVDAFGNVATGYAEAAVALGLRERSGPSAAFALADAGPT